MEAQRCKIRSAEFLFGAPSLSAIRGKGVPEVAVIGRSNVGKSTFINRLTGRKLARVSGTPGSTRQLNYFRIEGAWDKRNFALALVDMPGFGFAKLSKQEREDISRLSVEFLRERGEVHAVILLNDCRRTPQEDELAIQRLCAMEGIPCLVVLTKFDTLRQREREAAIETVSKGYNLEPGDVLLTGEKLGTDAVWERLFAVLGG